MMDRARTGTVSVLALVVLASVNLRPFLAAPGAVLPDIQADTGMGNGAISLLTLLPMILMGGGAFLTPRLHSCTGTRNGLIAALVLLFLGLILRQWAGDSVVFIVTAGLCGVAVAFIQSLVPGIIKATFPSNVAVISGLYSAVLMVGGAIGAYLTPVLTAMGFNWQQSLAWFAVPVLPALVLAAIVPLAAGTPPSGSWPARRLLSCSRTWTLMLIFGLTNGGYASVIAWLAASYQALGWSGADSAALVAVMAVCQVFCALGLPALARRRIDRRPWLLLALIMQAVGFAGLAFRPELAPFLWVGICGAGLGGSFSLTLVIALDHLREPEEAGSLATMMQGGGFLIAGCAPLGMAVLGHWQGFGGGWVMHLLLVAVAMGICSRLDPARYEQAMRPRVTAQGVP